MPTAYVVLSHTAEEQVSRLVRSILASSPDATVFVTHDGRRHPAAVITDERVHVRAHGRPTDWGSWDLVDVTLEAMGWARDTVDPDLLVVLSGQCYPVRPLRAWERQLLVDGAGWQGTATRLSYTPAWGRMQGIGNDNLTRYSYRWHRARLIDGALRTQGITAKAMWGLAHRLEPAASLRHVSRGRGAYVGIRRLASSHELDDGIYLGSQWLAVDRRLLDVVLAELAEGTTLRRLYEGSVIPDESAIQTVLARVQAPTTPIPTSYCVWEPHNDETRTLTLADLDEVRAAGSPFCRKVDSDKSAALMDALDELNGVT